MPFRLAPSPKLAVATAVEMTHPSGMCPFLRVYGWLLAVVAVAVVLLFSLVDPAPPA